MVIAGLTGGIATGKSTVAETMATSGAFIIDADRIARGVVRKGMPSWKEIIDHFGREILAKDGAINRVYLGKIVFNSPDRLNALNTIVHPRVFEQMNREMEDIKFKTPDAITILDVPLLIESGLHKLIPNIIVVYIPEHRQLNRLIARDHLSKKDAMARIRAQMPIDQKKTFAKFIIDNSSTIEQTRERTIEILKELKKQGE